MGHIESLRAVAALMVLCFHLISFRDHNGPLIIHEKIREYSEFGAQGVELFYIISGFVIYLSLTSFSFEFKHYPKYFLKRISRIFPPFWGTIGLICLTPFLWGWPFVYSFEELVQNATLSVDLFKKYPWMNEIFVTLKVEFLFYLCIGLLAVPMRKSIWSYGLLTFSFLGMTYFFHSVDLIYNIPYFLIGIACCELYRGNQKVLNYALLFCCLGFLAFVYQMQDFIISVLGVSMLLWLPIKNRLLEKIGHFSYSLYLTHGFSGVMLLYYFKNQTSVDWKASVYIVLAFISALVFAYFYYLVIEKWAIKWSKKIRY